VLDAAYCYRCRHVAWSVCLASSWSDLKIILYSFAYKFIFKAHSAASTPQSMTYVPENANIYFIINVSMITKRYKQQNKGNAATYLNLNQMLHSLYSLWQNAQKRGYVRWQRGTARIRTPLLLSAYNRSISPACWAHSSKLAAVACGGRMDGRTNARQFQQPWGPIYKIS